MNLCSILETRRKFCELCYGDVRKITEGLFNVPPFFRYIVEAAFSTYKVEGVH